MKAFVIKNKEGRYDGWDSWEEDIRYAFNYPSEEGAKCAIKQLGLKDCTVIPISICEGDLEEENRVLKRAFRNFIKEHIEVINEINGFSSLSVEEQEIDEYFDKCIQQAKESK